MANHTRLLGSYLFLYTHSTGLTRSHYSKLQGRTALITGADSGIGRATAILFGKPV
jgi:hypothetical protein